MAYEDRESLQTVSMNDLSVATGGGVNNCNAW